MNMGNNNICHMTTVAAANMLSLKQLEDPLEIEEAQGHHDTSAIELVDKDFVVDGGMMKSHPPKKNID